MANNAKSTSGSISFRPKSDMIDFINDAQRAMNNNRGLAEREVNRTDVIEKLLSLGAQKFCEVYGDPRPSKKKK